MNKKRFGQRLQKMRKEKHITGEQLAELTKLSTTYIRQLENGMRLPSLPVFVNITNALECSSDALLADNIIASEEIVLDELSQKLSGLPLERLAEITAVVDTMLDYMR